MTKARRFYGLLGVGVAAAFFACGGPSTGGAPGPDQVGGASGASGAGTGLAVGSGGAVFGAGGGLGNVPGGGGASQAGAPAGSGGSPTDLDASAAGFPDVTFHYDGSVTNGGPTSDSACASTSVTQTLSKTPADIIVIVDNSGSMQAEAGFVGNNLRNFSTQIVASGIDVHVVLISSYPGTGWGVCIDPPLGAGGCPTSDTKLPTFLHVDLEVGSNNPLQLILNTYPQWQGMLRPNAAKHVVVITDDQSDLDAGTFNTQFLALNPTLANYQFHAIYSYTAPDFLQCLAGGDVCCGLSAGEGTVYRQLVTQTRGVQGNLCTQDFGPVFTALQTAVVTGSGFLCTLPMPTPSSGIVDPEQVAVNLKWQGNPTGIDLPRVTDGGGCTPTAGGWYYDSPTNPTAINICQSTCDAAKAQTEPRLAVFLGCLGS